MATLPDIGPAVARAGFFGAALEAVTFGVARFGDAKQLAEVVQVRLRPGALGERVVFPEGDEGFGGAWVLGARAKAQCNDAIRIREWPSQCLLRSTGKIARFSNAQPVLVARGLGANLLIWSFSCNAT